MPEPSPGGGLPENAFRPLAPGETYQPIVPPQDSPPEVTPRAIALGLALTILFSAAAAFIALKLGQGVETAIPIAILAVGLSAVAARASTLLENLVIVALGATAGIVVGGSVFVMPAVFVLGLEERSSFFQLFLMPFLGCVLGVALMVPFRRYFVADMHGKLPFPEATATTEILVSGEKGGKAAGVLLASMGVGLVLDYLSLAMKAWRDIFTTALIPTLSRFTEELKAIFTLNTSAAVLGLGYIIGLRYAAIICAGSFLSYWVLVPMVARLGTGSAAELFSGLPPPGQLEAEEIFFQYVRLIGLGAIFAAGAMSVLKMSPVMVQAVRQVFGELRHLGSRTGENARRRTEADIPMLQVAGILVAVSVALTLYFRWVVLVDQPGAWVKTLVALVLTLSISGLFAAVSAWAVALISITPVSGMTLTTLIISAVVLGRLTGLAGEEGMLSILLIGGVVCAALSMTASMATLLKVGYWLGGTPRRIQWSLIGAAGLAAVTVTGVMLLFAHTQGYVASPEHPQPMPAPQANAMAAVVRSMMSAADAPWFLYGVGAVIAVIVEMTGVSGLAFALGMYLPMELNSPLLLGAVVAELVRRSARGDRACEKSRNERGTLVASGLIAGGALAGVLQAVTDVGQEWTGWKLYSFENDAGAGNWLGLAVFVGLALAVYVDAVRRRAQP
ncbi:MAG: oligopeptide transporter, OPT family [Acidobacteriota bacterium]